MGANPALMPASGVDERTIPYRYWWLAIILLSLGGWGVVISAVMLIAAIL